MSRAKCIWRSPLSKAGPSYTTAQKGWATGYRWIEKLACKSLQMVVEIAVVPRQDKLCLSFLPDGCLIHWNFYYWRSFTASSDNFYHLTKTHLSLSCAGLCPLTFPSTCQGHGYQIEFFAPAWYILQIYDFISHVGSENLISIFCADVSSVP